MTDRAPAVARPGDGTEVLHGAGDHYTFRLTGEDTDGQYFTMEGVVPPGGGPPPHIQTREEESFYILEGEITFWAGGERISGTAGSWFNIPKGVVHNFKNETDETARLLIFFAPAGIEQAFREMVTDAENPAHIAAVGRKYGIDFLDGDETLD
jgi:quercetin dioxygenase-like cupin family protein